ncbi:MAG: molecular chaperone HtpG, partial [Chthoniobacterales bacterium]|nr:molecular chaperone HtpG [Chthoniobacterales bacterium]
WRKEGQGWRWESDGGGSYTIEPAEGLRRGTKVVVKLKGEAGEFSLAERVEGALKRYSAFVPFPIYLNGKQVNTVQALWLKPREGIKEEEYVEFYKYHAHRNEEPLMWLHFSVDAPLQVYALLYVPSRNLERMGFGRMGTSVSLYCRKILIEQSPRGLLPEWLRFVHGVVDSEDLPLNISREAPQDRALIEKIGRVLTRRFLKFLEEMAVKDTEKYGKFIREFGFFLKEGAATDVVNRESLLSLLRFESSFLDVGKMTSLSEYVDRMKPGQEEIYYLVGNGRKMLEESPFMEGMKERGLEVLYCYDAVDEIVFENAREFAKKRFASADRAGLNLVGLEAPEAEGGLDREAGEELVRWLKSELGDRVMNVRISRRLKDSPVMALLEKDEPSVLMRRAMKAWNPEIEVPPLRVSLEINAAHSVIKKLHELLRRDKGRALLVANQLFDGALLAAGLVEDPVGMAKRMFEFVAKVGE